MGRRHRKNKLRDAPIQRDIPYITTDNVLDRRIRRRPDNLPKRLKNDRILEDRRYWRPERDRYDRQLDGRRVSYRSRLSQRVPLRRIWRAYEHPERVPVCRRRHTRRRVLFAMDLILRGRGRGGGKPRRLTENSRISCK
jgi:hypothetical protein